MKDKKIGIRPKLNIVSEDEYVSFSERFSNTTLRPIVALQHDLLLAVFKHNAKSRKLILKNLSNQKLIAFVDTLLFKDGSFRPLVLGLIVGHFTMDEHTQYTEKIADVDKLIIALVDELMHDSLAALKQ
tara:strand:+ start:131 stop:517 length:387 start_codon:yes stop_codon:yes gene_type:complete